MKVVWFLVLLSVISFAQNRSTIHSDLGELKIRMVYSNRDSFLKPCVATPSPCGLTNVEINVVNSILAKSTFFLGMDVVSAAQTPLLFTKDSKGQYPLYASDGTLGSRITLNKDRLVEAPFLGGAKFDIFVESILSYFFFQQSQKIEPSQQLGKKIAAFWGTLFKSISLTEFKDDQIELLVFKHNEVRILLLDSFQAHILNAELIKKLKCDDGFVVANLNNYSSLAWNRYNVSQLGATAGFRGILGHQCVSSKGEKQNWSSELYVDLDFQGATKKKWNSAALVVKVNGAKKVLSPEGRR